PLLSGARGGGSTAPSRVGAGRRDRDRPEGAARLRRPSDAASSGREQGPQARGGDSGRLRRLRPPRLEGGGCARAAAGEAPARARAEGEAVSAFAGLARAPAGREVARAVGAGGSRRGGREAAGPAAPSG